MSELKSQVMLWAGRLVKYATLASLSDRFGYGKVAGPQEDPSQGDKSAAQPVRFMQWFGFRSSPVVKGGECVVVAPRGGPSNAVALAADNLSVGPTDLKEGEAAMYGKAGQVLRQAEDGSTKIDAASGKDVVVNGGTATVAREGDEADGGALSVQIATVAGVPVISNVYYWEPGSVSATTVPAFPAKLAIKVKLGPGAPHFKA